MEWIMLVVGVATLYVNYAAFRIRKLQAPAPAPVSQTTLNLWSRYWPLVAMAGLTLLTWASLFLFRFFQPVPINAVVDWGSSPDICYSVVDMRKLSRYSGGYLLGLACGIGDATIDQSQDTMIAISSPFTIRPETVRLGARFTPSMLGTMKAMGAMHPPHPANIWHTLFLIPKGGDISRITKTADVKDFGGKIVPNCGFIE